MIIIGISWILVMIVMMMTMIMIIRRNLLNDYYAIKHITTMNVDLHIIIKSGVMKD